MPPDLIQAPSKPGEAREPLGYVARTRTVLTEQEEDEGPKSRNQVVYLFAFPGPNKPPAHGGPQ